MYLNECFFPTCVERFVCHSETIELIESVNEFNTVTSVRDLQSRSEQRHLLVCETESARRSCWLTVHFVPDRSAAEINWHRHFLFFLYNTSCVLKLLSLRILPPLKRYTIQHSTVVEWIYSNRMPLPCRCPSWMDCEGPSQRMRDSLRETSTDTLLRLVRWDVFCDSFICIREIIITYVAGFEYHIRF